MEIEKIVAKTEKMNNFVDDMNTDFYTTAMASYQQLEEIVNALNGMWEGDASEAYKQKMVKNLQRLKTRIEKAQSMSDLMKKAKNKYVKVEETILNDVIATITYQ